jgi:hypothetical protein
VNEFLAAYLEHYHAETNTGVIFGWAGYWIINKILNGLHTQPNLSKLELAGMHLAQQLLMEMEHTGHGFKATSVGATCPLECGDNSKL